MKQRGTLESDGGTNGDRIGISLAAPRFYPIYSGPAMRFQRYEPGLRARGIDMQVFAATSDPKEEASQSDGTGNNLESGELLPLGYVGQIPVQRVQVPHEGDIRKQWVYYRALAKWSLKVGRRPHLVQFLGALPLSVPWLLRLRSAKVPMVYTHTMLGELSHRSWKAKLQRLYRLLPFQLMDCVVVSSGVMRNALRFQGVTTRIEIIPNGVDLGRFHPIASMDARVALRRKLGLEPDSKVVVFVGAIIARKGIDVLLEAWSRVAPRWPRSRLLLVGPRRNELDYSGDLEARTQPALDAFIDRSGLSEKVVFTGAVNNVEDYLRAADVFVFPSEREGMPNVVLEAFACRLPTILTPFLGLPEEFGRPGEEYLLAERTPEALAVALETLLGNQEQSRRLGQAGLEWVREHLDVEKSIDQYAVLYRELARMPGAQRR